MSYRRSRERVNYKSACLLAAALTSALLASSPAAADLMWGINGHPLTSYPGITTRQQLELVRDLGTRSYRVDVSRTDQIARLAELTREARSLGLTVLPILIPPVDLAGDNEDLLYKKSLSFSRSVVTALAGQIPVWELGNEMENYAIIKSCETKDDGTTYPCEWGPAGGTIPLDYYGPRLAKVIAVLKGLSDGTRSADPAAKHAIGSAGWGHTAVYGRYREAGLDWDITVWHMYDQNPEWAFKIISQIGKPIWVTEFNNALGSQRDGEDGQAQGIAKTMKTLQDLRQKYNIEAAYIYELADESYWHPSYEAYMGVVKLDKTATGGWQLGRRKAAFGTVKALIDTSKP
ncbi:hypothetical protein [Heyndrickxia sporothermodurans]